MARSTISKGLQRNACLACLPSDSPVTDLSRFLSPLLDPSGRLGPDPALVVRPTFLVKTSGHPGSLEWRTFALIVQSSPTNLSIHLGLSACSAALGKASKPPPKLGSGRGVDRSPPHLIVGWTGKGLILTDSTCDTRLGVLIDRSYDGF